MKILYSGESLYPPVSAGDISVLTLLEELEREHEVEAICTGKKNEIIEHSGIKIYHVKTPHSHLRSWVKRYFLNKLWFNLFDAFLEKRKYDLVITQAELTPASTIIAKNHGMKVLIFVRDFQHFCLSILRDVKGSGVWKKHNCLKHATWKYKIQYPFFRETIKWFKTSFDMADIVFVNSTFIQKLAREYGVKSTVVHPFVKTKDFVTKRKSPEYITMVRPYKRKGLEIFLKISDAMPGYKFLAVGGSEKVRELIKRRNIKYIPWTNDMKSIYARTRILLLPSIWQEPFSRTPLEAMSNGIPCIVSNTGGTPGEVGDAGIIVEDLFNINAWVNAIKRLDDEKLYRELSKKSIKRVKNFDFKVQYAKFKKRLKRGGIIS